MTFAERTAALAHNQLEQRLISAAPRILFRSQTCTEDLAALVAFVESEIQRALLEQYVDLTQQMEVSR